MKIQRNILGLIVILFISILLTMGSFISLAFGGLYDWPMDMHNSACTGFSPSNAPNTNATAWIADLPGGTVWAYPIVAEGKVFIPAGGYFNAFDENTGSLIWSFSAPGQPGYPKSAAFGEGKAFFGTGEPGPEGCVYALNATTGYHMWNLTTEGYAGVPPVFSEDRLYFGADFGSSQAKIYCLNATTGAFIWSSVTQDRVVAVAIAYEKVYASSGHWQTGSKAAIYCLDKNNGAIFWSFGTDRTLASSLSVANGKVYCAVSNIGAGLVFYALNATNGDVVWSTTRYSSGEGGRTAVAYGKVFFGTARGARGVYAMNETNGDEIWAFPTSQNVGGGPVVADGKVFFASGYPSHMFYAVNESSGAVVWSYRLVGDVHSWSSAVAHGRVFVADHWDAKLYAFGVAHALSLSISPLSASINVGDSLTFTSTVTGGSPPYSYQWNLNGSAVSGAIASSWTFTPTASESYLIHLEVTDFVGTPAQSETAHITVAAVPIGGYSIPISGYSTAKPLTPYLILTAVLTIAFTTIKHKTTRKKATIKISPTITTTDLLTRLRNRIVQELR